MNDIRKNVEGYNDPTPYNAIKNVEGGHNMNIKAGEIWECSTGVNELKMFLVLKVFKKVALVLSLNEEKKSEDDFEVICKGIRFTTPYMISYKFEKGFVNYVKSIKEDEFETLINVVRCHLEFEEDGKTFEEAAHEMINDLKIKLEGAKRELDEETDRYNKLLAEVEAHRPILSRTPKEVEHALNLLDSLKKSKPMTLQPEEEVKWFDEEKICLKIEKDLYKSLYEQTLDRLIK